MLSDLKFKTFYSTESDNIPRNFYSLALNESVAYDRVSGYFSAKSLSHYAIGIERLLVNNGKMRLIVSHELSEQDYNAIVNGYKSRETIIQNKLLNLLSTKHFSNQEKLDFSNLCYLIEIGLVDIKIGFTFEGLFHAKFGMFKDQFANIVYFSGSLNETESAFKRNYEEITVLNSWELKNNELYEKEKYFDMLWNNTINSGMIFVKTIDEVVKKHLVSFSRGKVIVNKEIFEEDSLILYFDDRLYLQNNLLNKEIDRKARVIKKLINKGLLYSDLETFANDLTYIQIEEIVRLFERFTKRYAIKLVVTDSVYNYIRDKKFEIDEIAKRGLAIKEKNEIFTDDFNRFKEIVEGEVNRSLYKIQNWVSYYQARMKRVANFSVPGAGKTSMVYGTYAFLSSREINKVDKLVVVGPKNSFLSWKEEFKNVFGKKKKLSVLDIHDSSFTEEMFYKNIDDFNLILVNYESLPRYYTALKNVVGARTMLVFDEVHKIKRVESERAIMAIDLARKVNYRYVLTGTPIPNNYQDVWNFLHILYDDEFYGYFKVSLPQLNNPDYYTIKDINEKMLPFFWRVTKKELGVPSPNPDYLIKTQASNVEQQIIDLLWRKYSNNPFKLYIRLIQLSSNPSLLKENITYEGYADTEKNSDSNSIEIIDDIPEFTREEEHLIDSLETSSKFLKCVEVIQELVDESKKVIVWCVFVNTIQKLNDLLTDRGYKIAVVYGAIDIAEREKIILDFQNGQYDILITNPHTLAESVSLHKVAHDALYLEYTFNLTHMLQSRDRIHRLGLAENQETNYYYFMLEGERGLRNTIDNKIYTRLMEKQALMLEAIERPDIAPDFSIDEKEEILSMMREELE